MFVSLSKTMKKLGGFRFGFGIRINKKNAAFMLFIMLFYWIFTACLYMGAFCVWMLYAMCYGIYWLIKKIFQKVTDRKQQV